MKLKARCLNVIALRLERLIARGDRNLNLAVIGSRVPGTSKRLESFYWLRKALFVRWG